MKRMCERRWRASTCALTLVETLAGSLLLGTLLVAILVARGQLAIQSRRAQDRLAACQMLDELMESWWPERDQFPRRSAGDVPGHEGWRWQTRLVASNEASALVAETVAVELFAPGQTDTVPAARVEILLPAAEIEEPDEAQNAE